MDGIIPRRLFIVPIQANLVDSGNGPGARLSLLAIEALDKRSVFPQLDFDGLVRERLPFRIDDLRHHCIVVATRIPGIAHRVIAGHGVNENDIVATLAFFRGHQMLIFYRGIAVGIDRLAALVEEHRQNDRPRFKIEAGARRVAIDIPYVGRVSEAIVGEVASRVDAGRVDVRLGRALLRFDGSRSAAATRNHA